MRGPAMAVTGWLCLTWAAAALVANAAAAGNCTSQGSQQCRGNAGTSWLQLKGVPSRAGGGGEPEFFPVHGGADRRCAGAHATDAADSRDQTTVKSLDECKNRCLSRSSCKGISFQGGRCEAWSQRIVDSVHAPGSTCLRLVQDVAALQSFVAVNGGRGRGCRGAHAGDKQDSYYTAARANTVEECKAACVEDPDCQGVSFATSGSCELWTRPGGIEATAEEQDSICLQKPTPTPPPTPRPTPPPGGQKDWEMFYGMNCYQNHGADIFEGKDPLQGGYSLQQCQEECFKEPDCQGIVMPQQQGSTCWLRKNIIKKNCRQGHPFNFWKRPGIELQGEGWPSSEAACCADFESWPNRDGEVKCSGCTALVKTAPYGNRCDQYCESFGHVCYQAAEETNENCDVKYTARCDEPILSTSDMLCSCRFPQDMDEPICDWPGPEPPAPTTTPEPVPEQCCKNVNAWPDVDAGVTCDDCMALVLTAPYGGRCDRYCESFGHVCVGAAEEKDDNCEVAYTKPCNEAIPDTSDMLCKCVKPNAPPSCPVPPPTTATTTTGQPTPTPGRRIQVVGKQLLVDGVPLHMKGVAWNPVPKGGVHPRDLAFARFVEQDAEIMQRMGINAIRTYEPITDKNVLDILWRRGIWVVNSVYNWGGASATSAAEPVRAVKDHPAILMWSIGNEWNYNGLYVGMSFFDCIAKIRDVANVVREIDTSHPISSIYGDTGKLREAADSLPQIDVWGINAYRGISFGNLFDSYDRASDKPMYLGEYGADAFNALINGEDRESQAKATKELTEEIIGHTSVLNRGSCIGGFVFEFNDEWHKDNEGKPTEHDTGGVAPGGGPYPDRTFNEEWWGLVTIDREVRPAFRAYASTELPQALTQVTAMTA